MEDLLRQLQLTELDILKTVHSFCVQHGIEYSLYAGTLLGAVRHKGFIPWDDDIDICMSRNEYNRFIRLWQEDPVEGYVLQNKDNSPAFMSSFTKIRKDHTTFLEQEQDIGQFHTGIFIDVFPLDRIPSAWLSKRVFYLRCMVYQLMIRGYPPPDGNPIVRLGCRVILRIIGGRNRRRVEQRMLNKLTENQNDMGLKIVEFANMCTLKVEYPENLLESTTELPFEDGCFQVYSDWKVMLTQHFGDYMCLPPEEERTWTHHPICIDFEHNIEEIIALNDTTDTHSLSGL